VCRLVGVPLRLVELIDARLLKLDLRKKDIGIMGESNSVSKELDIPV